VTGAEPSKVSDRIYRRDPATARWAVLALVILALGIAAYIRTVSDAFGDLWGYDFEHYLDAARRWIETGTPYLPSEVAGPFDYSPLTFLHPPVSLWLFTPFLVLPAVLWWAIPLGIVGSSVWSWRPAPWSWPLLAAAVAYPRFQAMVIVGNTDLWVWAALALGLRYGWPALAIVIKPSLAFLALVGARHRSFWLGIPVLVVACLPFGSLWLEWIAVVQNSPGDIAYSALSLPWLLAPVVAWVARRRFVGHRL
jgi:hypothetical protein